MVHFDVPDESVVRLQSYGGVGVACEAPFFRPLSFLIPQRSLASLRNRHALPIMQQFSVGYRGVPMVSQVDGVHSFCYFYFVLWRLCTMTHLLNRRYASYPLQTILFSSIVRQRPPVLVEFFRGRQGEARARRARGKAEARGSHQACTTEASGNTSRESTPSNRSLS